jgi:hypothetical protein
MTNTNFRFRLSIGVRWKAEYMDVERHIWIPVEFHQNRTAGRVWMGAVSNISGGRLSGSHLSLRSSGVCSRMCLQLSMTSHCRGPSMQRSSPQGAICVKPIGRGGEQRRRNCRDEMRGGGVNGVLGKVTAGEPPGTHIYPHSIEDPRNGRRRGSNLKQHEESYYR